MPNLNARLIGAFVILVLVIYIISGLFHKLGILGIALALGLGLVLLHRKRPDLYHKLTSRFR